MNDAAASQPKPTVSDHVNALVESQLHERVKTLEGKLKADVLFYAGPIYFGIDDLIRDAIEKIEKKRDKLAVVLETNGGYIEVVQRIADTFRHHYPIVDFIVPNYAMSAGTVLVLSGDAIWMDYYSILGPIDPQVENKNGEWIPALGYLVQYQRLIKKSHESELSTAEATYLIEKFDPAALYRYEQERELSVSLLQDWLAKYKFKNWIKTDGRGIEVTDEMRKERAKEIATLLNEPDHWHSHSRGISMEVLRRDLKLVIEDFEADAELNSLIREYYKFIQQYKSKIGKKYAIHIRGQFEPVLAEGT